jgi:hypothetical protein
MIETIKKIIEDPSQKTLKMLLLRMFQMLAKRIKNHKFMRARIFIHILGLSCIGGSVFLQMLVFSNMAMQGYFYAVEKNKLMLSLEMILTMFALIYFLYIYQRFIRSLK